MATTALRVKKHRETLREQGLRPVQVWVPDTRKEAVVNILHMQVQNICNDPWEHAHNDWSDQAATEIEGWE